MIACPDVSVVVAARNEETYVIAALTSILSQERIAHELIYVDDHSTDNTLNLVKRLTNENKNLFVYENPSRGKCSAFNFGVSQAKGRFVCIFAGDDLMPKGSLYERFESVRKELDDIPVVGLSKLITMSDNPKFDGHIVPRGKGKGATSGVSPLMNRLAAKIIFPTPEHLPNEDTWMELAILHMPEWRVVHSDAICCRWRVHSGNSINHTVDFDTYNKKITVRMEALELFLEKFGAQLYSDQRRLLNAKIEMERARRSGNWFRVISSQAPLVDRLRALSITNSTMYGIRKRLYGLLSGW